MLNMLQNVWKVTFQQRKYASDIGFFLPVKHALHLFINMRKIRATASFA